MYSILIEGESLERIDFVTEGWVACGRRTVQVWFQCRSKLGEDKRVTLMGFKCCQCLFTRLHVFLQNSQWLPLSAYENTFGLLGLGLSPSQLVLY